MQITLRRCDISVAENIFYDVDVGAARVQPRPQGVTQIMEEFYHYIVHENGDWDAVEEALAIRSKGGASSSKLPTHTRERMIFANGTYPFVGSYDDVVEAFRQMAEAVMDGVALGMVNYIDDLPAVRDEVLPRIERLGLRETSA